MKNNFRGQLYLAWSGFIFAGVFLCLFPLFYICIVIKPLRKYSFLVNKVWSIIFFPAAGLFVEVDRRFRPKYGESYVYVANHSSFLDIPTLTWVLPGFICFIGKSTLGKVPLFGFVFNNLHIGVNRKNSHDRLKSMDRASDEIRLNKRSVVFFAEGTIDYTSQPQLIGFKDGAFKVAIETKVKLVPITIPYNWIIMPAGNYKGARYHESKVIIHEAIDTANLQPEDYLSLKKQVFSIIDNETNKHNTPEKIARYGGKQRHS